VSGDEGTRRLTEAIEAFAAERAPDLVAEATAEAVAKARTMLTDALAESLLAGSAELLAPSARPKSAGSTGRTTRTRRSSPRRSRPATAERRREPPPDRRAESRQPVPAPAPAGDAELAHYVYGVAFAPVELPDAVAGVDPAFPVDCVEEDDLAAIVSRVPLAEFGEAHLRENLNDVSWLEEKARAHERVLDEALQRGTVVPMRLCTIYSGEEQVREMLRGERDVLLDALRRLEGTAEWGVKVIAEPGALERVAAERAGVDAGEDEAELSRGAAYMNRKRRLARTREEELQLAEDWAREVHGELAEAAREALLNPLQRPDISGYEGDMLLNGVYLVEDRCLGEFRALVERLTDDYRALGVGLELTGPWPPYNFVKSSIEAAR
jgi:hypothetical protein